MVDHEPVRIRRGAPWWRWQVATLLASTTLVGLLIAASRVSGVDVPQVRGDQLFFFFDARKYEDPAAGLPARVTFATIFNPGSAAVAVEVAAYDRDLTLIVAETLEIGPGQRELIGLPDRYAAEHPGIHTAGLLVVTPVEGVDDDQPVVPPSQLAGSFTVAGPYNGFGESAFGRSVDGEHDAGDLVDGTIVKYETVGPTSGILMIPGYFDPENLSPPDKDGNRVVLVAFEDLYEDGKPFRIVAPDTAVGVKPTFCGELGAVTPQQTPAVGGVLVTDLEALGGDATPHGGSVVFEFDRRQNLNVFGVFSQALEHLGAGHRLPAAGRTPPCPTPAPTPVPPPTGPTPRPICGNGVVEDGEQCDTQEIKKCYEVVGADDLACPGDVRCVGCLYDTSACAPCPCDADSDCHLKVDCSAVRPGCGSITACRAGICLSARPVGAQLEEICSGRRPEDGDPRCP